LRRVVRELARHEPDVRLGVTGLPVLEHDEMQASQDDMLRTGLVSLVGVAVLFITGFGGVRLPLMTVLALLLAMAWSFGFVTLAVGHLNILSISFGVILIGLGIDFGIHFVTRYQQVRLEAEDVAGALRETASSVGPGIVTGGLTTALAFCSAWLTDFTGVAELGVIAGGGILLCIAAALLVLPALILTVDGNDIDGAAERSSALPVGRMCWPLVGRPKWALGVAVLVTLGLAAGLPRLRYDHNLLNLQPRNLESVELERRLLERSDRSVWFALSVCDSPAELLARKARFERLPSVQRTEQIADLLPAHDPRRAVWIQQIRRRLSGLPDRAPLVRAASRSELRSELERIGPLVEDPAPATGPGSVAGPGRAAVERLLVRLDALAENECLARLGRFQQR
ncbi:MAG: MMPL family transporter, partial [Pirellulaceae bacterium]|nr:MMPL family transporter [Pirellulaceae bacterium]